MVGEWAASPGPAVSHEELPGGLGEEVSDGEELAMKARVVEDADVVTYVVVCDPGDEAVAALAQFTGLHGHERQQAVTALRSLFTGAKEDRRHLPQPATRIKLGKREHPVWQPLTAAHLAEAFAAAATPPARLCVILAAVHAARPGAIRALHLDDVDLAGQRLRLAGTDRPMGNLTCRVVREWLEYRQRRWPHTANPHLLVSRESALHHGPVSTAYLTSLRGLPATLERLRIDCQLAEAMATGFDPLRLAEVFGISEQTAIRYAVNARQLNGPARQGATPGFPGSPRPDPGGAPRP